MSAVPDSTAVCDDTDQQHGIPVVDRTRRSTEWEADADGRVVPPRASTGGSGSRDPMKPTLHDKKVLAVPGTSGSSSGAKSESKPLPAPQLPVGVAANTVALVIVDENVAETAANRVCRDRQAQWVTFASANGIRICLTTMGTDAHRGHVMAGEPANNYTGGNLGQAIHAAQPPPRVYSKGMESDPEPDSCALFPDMANAGVRNIVLMGQETGACVKSTAVRALLCNMAVHTGNTVVRNAAINRTQWRADWNLVRGEAIRVSKARVAGGFEDVVFDGGYDFDQHLHLYEEF